MDSETWKYEHLYKIILLGDCGVGKSHLLRRYLHNDFEPDLDATIGAEFAEK